MGMQVSVVIARLPLSLGDEHLRQHFLEFEVAAERQSPSAHSRRVARLVAVATGNHCRLSHQGPFSERQQTQVQAT